MSVVMKDAVELVSTTEQKMHDDGLLASLLYADDTLLIGVSNAALQHFLDAVASSGASCGLELHWDNFQLISIRCDHDLRTPAGVEIETNNSICYLGTSLAADGKMQAEIAKKLGIAWADFSTLERLWKHTSISKDRKIEVFQATVTSRLLYGLSGAWINVAERRRIDGFQSRCLRKILRIPPAYVQGSRISTF
jgi:hypothetical protein